MCSLLTTDIEVKIGDTDIRTYRKHYSAFILPLISVVAVLFDTHVILVGCQGVEPC